MKVFVTGATGFVGSWVVAEFIRQYPEAQLVCLVRPTSNLRWLQHQPVILFTGSLTDPESLLPALEGVDYVLHIAGVTKALHIADYYRGNVAATQNLLEAVYRAAPDVQKVVHISSQAAVGPSPSPEPIDESHPCHPITDYGKSKLESEKIARQWMDRLPITILRPPAVYGPRDTDVFQVFKNLKWGIELKIGGREQWVSIIHVFDLARGIVLAATHPASAGETYFVCNDDVYPWSHITRLLQQIIGKKAVTLSIPYPIAYGAAAIIEAVAYLRRKPTILNRQKMREVRQPYWGISNRKIKQQLGFRQSISLEEGLRQTFQWYLEQGWL
ncbi:MAG: NAD-dependent epimerase/dehydratase family protein [Calditrichaeota bacterium]|nr:NAD-dependent epimerase/dehydratase family protein [Calditrichota bacterium]